MQMVCILTVTHSTNLAGRAEMDDVIEVTVSFKVKVSRSVWDMNFGTGTSARLVRDDVKVYVENGVKDQFRDLGLLAD